MILPFVLLLASVAHWGSVLPLPMGTQPNLDTAWPVVFVRNCDGSFEEIYSDVGMTKKMPNPFLGERDGTYSYFSASSEEKVMVMFGKYGTVHNTCKKREQ